MLTFITLYSSTLEDKEVVKSTHEDNKRSFTMYVLDPTYIVLLDIRDLR